jgi:hypothetical protein
VVLDSQVVGAWRPTIKRDGALIRFELYAPLDEAQTRVLHESASEYSDWLGLPASVEVSVVPAKTG